MRINEIFSSIQGEGLWTGMPMTFVRLQGCNLRCPFCDTPEAIDLSGGRDMHVDDVFAEMLSYYPTTVCITGGEPMLQIAEGLGDLCDTLHRHYEYRIHLETNGTFPLHREEHEYFDWITVSPKPPVYNCYIPMEHVNEVKLVVGAPNEVASFPGAVVIENYLKQLPDGTPIWLQPDNNRREAFEWAKTLIATTYAPPLRLGISMQVHKLIKER